MDNGKIILLYVCIALDGQNNYHIHYCCATYSYKLSVNGQPSPSGCGTATDWVFTIGRTAIVDTFVTEIGTHLLLNVAIGLEGLNKMHSILFCVVRYFFLPLIHIMCSLVNVICFDNANYKEAIFLLFPKKSFKSDIY